MVANCLLCHCVEIIDTVQDVTIRELGNTCGYCCVYDICEELFGANWQCPAGSRISYYLGQVIIGHLRRKQHGITQAKPEL